MVGVPTQGRPFPGQCTVVQSLGGQNRITGIINNLHHFMAEWLNNIKKHSLYVDKEVLILRKDTEKQTEEIN